ncbi:hypothetical protein ANANG_G00282360 [Anguilla anguilla]|uniref:FAM171 N-terminal domain-containing protein n=1 Tax=Anguilla anguilla TaxID=7936 RepID=A0A9D3LNR8_ANGAN|nr:hypothetical protein ANANG_G00282360 [Anguilla anguilla]
MKRTRWHSMLQAQFYFRSDVSVSPLSFAMYELPGYLLLALFIFSEDALTTRGEGGSTAAGPAVLTDNNVNLILQKALARPLRLRQLHRQVRKASVSASAGTFTLKVQVKDVCSRQSLSRAAVDVFVNHTRTDSSLTGDDGAVLLQVPYRLGLALTVLARRDGYVPAPLPWRTTRMPVFSSVTLSLFPHNQGNIWLFEDSVLISGKVSDTASQPSVRFPKSLLNLPDQNNISSVTAYLTMPQLPSEKDHLLYTVGMRKGSGSLELSPVAAVSVQLYSDGREIQVTGPIQITLPLPDHTRLHPSSAMPAWTFDLKTGAWIKRGLGLVKLEEDGLVWTYEAPHLGYWIAAPLPSPRGYMGHGTTVDFISYHTYLLMAILGGTLVIVIGFLAVLLCYCRGCICKPEKKGRRGTKMAVLKRDQTTSTNGNGNGEASFRYEDRSRPLTSRTGGQRDDLASSRHKSNFNIYVEDVGRPCAKLYENVGGPDRGRPAPPAVRQQQRGGQARGDGRAEEGAGGTGRERLLPRKAGPHLQPAGGHPPGARALPLRRAADGQQVGHPAPEGPAGVRLAVGAREQGQLHPDPAQDPAAVPAAGRRGAAGPAGPPGHGLQPRALGPLQQPAGVRVRPGDAQRGGGNGPLPQRAPGHLGADAAGALQGQALAAPPGLVRLPGGQARGPGAPLHHRPAEEGPAHRQQRHQPGLRRGHERAPAGPPGGARQDLHPERRAQPGAVRRGPRPEQQRERHHRRLHPRGPLPAQRPGRQQRGHPQHPRGEGRRRHVQRPGGQRVPLHPSPRRLRKVRDKSRGEKHKSTWHLREERPLMKLN